MDDQSLVASQLVRVGMLRTVAVAVPASALAVVGAFLLSPLAPVGRARELEPDTGFAFDSSRRTWVRSVWGMVLTSVMVVLLCARR